MKAEGLKFFTDIPLTLLGLILFMTTFILLAIWTKRKSADVLYRRLQLLPLNDSEPNKENDR